MNWRDTWWGRLYIAPFTVLVAFLAFDRALIYYTIPASRMGVDKLWPWLVQSWILAYGLGGTLLVLGICMNAAHIEKAGCSLFIGGSLANLVALTAESGLAAWNQLFVLALFVLATTARLIQLSRGQVLILTLSE